MDASATKNQTFPVPDPTILTTTAIAREIQALKELIEVRFEGYDRAIALLQNKTDKSPSVDVVAQTVSALESVVETRLDAMDKAIELLHEGAKGNPVYVQSAVEKLQDLHEEKFRSIALQFSERDVRTEQTAKDSKVAVDAALQAAKEAVGEQNKSSALAIAKSESATTKQIDAIGMLIQTTAKAVDDKIDDLKSRLTTIEGMRSGVQENRHTTKDYTGLMIAAVAVIIAAVSMFMRMR